MHCGLLVELGAHDAALEQPLLGGRLVVLSLLGLGGRGEQGLGELLVLAQALREPVPSAEAAV
jgi:hypothetical protein